MIPGSRTEVISLSQVGVCFLELGWNVSLNGSKYIFLSWSEHDSHKLGQRPSFTPQAGAESSLYLLQTSIATVVPREGRAPYLARLAELDLDHLPIGDPPVGHDTFGQTGSSLTWV